MKNAVYPLLLSSLPFFSNRKTKKIETVSLQLPDQTLKLSVNDDIHLTAIQQDDARFLVQYMNDEEIYNNTLNIPNPYFESDAQWFIDFCHESDLNNQLRINWTIRDKHTGDLMGCIGRLLKYGPVSHKDEIGYWLARPFWNKGIMTQVVQAFCQYLEKEQGLLRIEACIYWFNTGSQRVLEKSGFQQEGLLRKFTHKGGEYRDCILFSRISEIPVTDK